LVAIVLGSVLLYVVLGMQGGMVARRPKERPAAQELVKQGHTVVSINGLVSWPHGQGHAKRLFHELEQHWDGSGLAVVVSTTKPELAQKYEQYGFTPVHGSSPAVLFRCF